MSHLESYFKEEDRKSGVHIISTDIIMDFCKNLEHGKKNIHSEVEYKGIKDCVVFYDMRQFTEALNKLANLFYKRLEEVKVR